MFSSRTTARTLCSIPVKLHRPNGKAHSPKQLSGTALDYQKLKYFENLALTILLLYFVSFTHLKENKPSDLTA